MSPGPEKSLPALPATWMRSADERRCRRLGLLGWLEGELDAPPVVGELPPRVEDWPEDALESWHERAAIMEFCGPMPRHVAEREAEKCVREEVARAEARGPPARI